MPLQPSRNDGENQSAPNIMELCRIGDIRGVNQLLADGTCVADFSDHEGLTPLHWAAINNHYDLCKLLLDGGADVNARGGSMMASPVIWAASRGHHYIVDFLLQRGADPTIEDSLGFGLMHVTVFSGNINLLALLLYEPLSVDCTDATGQTPMMCAAYRGYNAFVDTLLRWGASVQAADKNGLTALHWSLVGCSFQCASKLIEYGADRLARTHDGKTPAMVAQEVNMLGQWKLCLERLGYAPDGRLHPWPKGMPAILRDQKMVRWISFFWCFPFLALAMWCVTNLSIYLSVPITAACYLSIFVAIHLAKAGAYIQIIDTPFHTGFFCAGYTAIFVGFLTNVLPAVLFSRPFECIAFCILFFLSIRLLVICMTEDPGYTPRQPGRKSERDVIAELLSQGRFDNEHFCVICLAKKPLRSNHCRTCDRCVSKFDHHCPIIYNCIGVNNVRHFVLFLFVLEFGTILFLHLDTIYILSLPPYENTCRIVSKSVCDLANRDTFPFLTLLWAIGQCIFVTSLCVSEVLLIVRGTTTNETVKLYRERRARWKNRVGRERSRQNKIWRVFKVVTGIEALLALTTRTPKSAKVRNPYSAGCIQNCRDFWFEDSSYAGLSTCLGPRDYVGFDTGNSVLAGRRVNYHELYEMPYLLEARSRELEDA